MKLNISLGMIVLTVALGGCAANKPASDPALVGTWKGLREANGKCQFLSWNTDFKPDGKFTITFFRDAKQSQRIQAEHGTWIAANGKNALKTDGVPSPDVYNYTFIDADTVHYTSVTSDPSGDCQEDYAFTEHRIRG
jgi:hypothetical protein